MTTPSSPISTLPSAKRQGATTMVYAGLAGTAASLLALFVLSLVPPPPAVPPKKGATVAPVTSPAKPDPLKAGAGLFGFGSLALLAVGASRSTKQNGLQGREITQLLQSREQSRVSHDKQYAGLQAHLVERETELTETKTALEKQLRQMQRTIAKASRLESAVESTNDVIMLYEAPLQTGQPMRLIYVNPAFERMTGYSREELAAQSPKMLQGIMTDPETVALLQEKLSLFQPVRVELINYRKDGSQFWVELNIQPIYDANGLPGGWMSVQRDISQQKSVTERMAYQATHDALTGLPNRTLFDRRLGEAITAANATEGQVGILFFDVDRFKQINDTLGHPVGDKLLQQVASRLTSRLHRHDTVARMGGDEFTILMPNVPSTEVVAETAQSLLEAMDEAFEIDGQELFVTGSIGVSLAPRDGTDAATLLKNADTAMYRAKEEGRDGFRVYTPSMNARAKDRLELETQLRRALDKNELYLQYQPQVDLQTGRIYGVEALLRWESPSLGRISPAQFIPLAEETGLIIPIGDFVLREAAAQAARWVEAGTPLRVSVNLSGRQFEQPWIVDLIGEVIKEVNLPPEYLDIEMTEGILVKGDNVKNRLVELKALGVRLSIDDFGTGYSSLSYLRTFPLDVLKIDRSFITPMTEEIKGEAMVRALVELGHACSMEVIAEGVETDAQRDALNSLGCDAMQGFLMSPPVSAREVDLLVRKTAAAICVTPPAKPQLRLVS
ncbi:MAG: EAL domain-containing protein [Armatimonadetes bacterium]|nr:EAL domain-containing protein [Armatimonadota bacterium]